MENIIAKGTAFSSPYQVQGINTLLNENSSLMGTIKQGLLGGCSNKVGIVIGSSWKGISYMRGHAQSVRNPRTEGQMEQRSKFALTLDFLKPITAYVRTGYKSLRKASSITLMPTASMLKRVMSMLRRL